MELWRKVLSTLGQYHGEEVDDPLAEGMTTEDVIHSFNKSRRSMTSNATHNNEDEDISSQALVDDDAENHALFWKYG